MRVRRVSCLAKLRDSTRNGVLIDIVDFTIHKMCQFVYNNGFCVGCRSSFRGITMRDLEIGRRNSKRILEMKKRKKKSYSLFLFSRSFCRLSLDCLDCSKIIYFLCIFFPFINEHN